MCTLELFKEETYGFKEYLMVKNQSPATIETYLRGIKPFFVYLLKNGIDDVREVTKDMISDYQHYLIRYTFDDGRRYTMNTVTVKLRSIKRFFEYLEDARKILFNPAERIRMPDLGERLPSNIITKEEVKKILNAPNTSTLIGIRDKMILELLYSTGIRLEELYNLTIYDVEYRSGYLRVTKGKFAKDRVVPIGNVCCKYVKEYINKVRPILTKKSKDERALLVGKCGRKLNKQIIPHIIKDYAKKAGINRRVTVHTWRHTFASHLLSNGAGITHVQKLLGHSRLDVTKIYTKVTPKEVKAMHQKRHPRERIRGRIKPIKEKLPCAGTYKVTQ